MEYFNKNLKKFLPYIEDLRLRLYRGVILFIVFFSIGFLSAGPLLKFILTFIHINSVTIATTSPFQFADVAMDIGFFTAIIITAPYLIYSFYTFISPALSKTEKKRLFLFIPLCLGLFIIGFTYGFYMLYYAFGLLASINVSLGIENIWNISQFLSQIFITAALLGLVFEFPLILTLLIKIGLLKKEMLKSKRRIAYFIMFCIVSTLPPTDGISMLAMSLPLVVLYEMTILLNNNKKYVWTWN